MGHRNNSFPSSVCHSPHVEHSLWLLLDFSWPQTMSLAFLYNWVCKVSWSTAILKNSILQSPLPLTCRTNLWIECVSGMDGAWWMLSGSTIRLNYQLSGFIRFRLVYSNNRWHKFHGSIRKVFGCMDHNLAWLYFSENGVFDGFAYVIHYRTSTMTYSRTFFLVIVEK